MRYRECACRDAKGAYMYVLCRVRDKTRGKKRDRVRVRVRNEEATLKT